MQFSFRCFNQQKEIMASIKNMQERIVEKVMAGHPSLEDNETFEETVVKVEAYESERDITQALDNYVPNTEEERRLVMKVDLKLLPILGVMYAVQCMDRNLMVSTMFKRDTWLWGTDSRPLERFSNGRQGPGTI
jgi:hypothetical protein